MTMPQPLHLATTIEIYGKPKTTPQPTNSRQMKRFERKRFHSSKLGYRQAQCYQKERGAENETLRTRDRQQTPGHSPQFNRKSVCRICACTGHSAKYCNQRQKVSPYRQIPYEKQTQNETRNQRREIKKNNEACAQGQPTYRSFWF